jgi:hypothetical protein
MKKQYIPRIRIDPDFMKTSGTAAVSEVFRCPAGSTGFKSPRQHPEVVIPERMNKTEQ